MKLTLAWLMDHLDTNADIDAITDALTAIGLEVESVEDPGKAMGHFTICRVKEARQHPDADRLRICTVTTWPDGSNGQSVEVDVVCGAPNARSGMIGVFAPVGSWIPGTGIRLRKATIKGVDSHGMLCSERELMISDEHDGIIDLPEDAPLGERYIDWSGMNDPVIDLAVTPNRPDALGVRGIARDLAAFGLGTLRQLPVPAIEGKFCSPVGVRISSTAKEKDCPLFCGRMIRGVRNVNSPKWMQQRLRSIGLRPISALVDVTNYITHDRNRPLHVFDTDKLNGSLHIHHANGGEMIEALDGQEYTFDPDMLSISDDTGPVSLAGLMGGDGTGCSESTVNVFVESALWDPVTVARSGRRLKINSDARYRFERGVDPEYAREGLELATELIVDMCGGEPSEIVCDGEVPDSSRSYSLGIERVARLVGMDIETGEQLRILQELGFCPELSDKRIVVDVPSWRPDIHGEADLVEEVARIANLSKLEGKPIRKARAGVAVPIMTPMQKREQTARRRIASLGYRECVTYSFTDKSLAFQFMDSSQPVELDNPISSELDVMRPDLMPGLLMAAARNQKRGFNDLAIFEVGPVFHGPEPGDQYLQAAGLLVGNAASRSPHARLRSVDIYDVKADLESVMSAVSPTLGFRTGTATPAGWHPARTGCLYLRPGHPLAIFGEIGPKVLRKVRIRGRAVGFTILIDRIPMPRKRKIARSALEINDLQSVVRDFAFIVSDRMPSGDVLLAASRTRYRDHVEDMNIFDEFAGPRAEKQFGKGYKSIAFSVRLKPKHKAFRDEDITRISADIIQMVTKRTGGTLRDQ